MKKTDKAILSAALFLFVFVIAYAATGEIVAASIAALVLTVTLIYAGIHIAKRYGKLKKFPVSKIEDGLAFIGIAEQTKILFSSVAESQAPALHENYFTFTEGKMTVAVFPSYKFSSCSKDDIAKIFKTCKEGSIEKCYVLSRQNSREILLFARGLPLDFRFVRTKELRAYLTKHNLTEKILLPEKKREKKKSPKETFAAVAENIFTKERAKYFFVVGATLAFFGIFTPFRIYYAVFAGLNLLISIIGLIKSSA